MSATPRRVLGIDPGLAATGFGIVDDHAGGARMVACGALRTSPREARALRLAQIHDRICELITEHRPTEVAIEQHFVAENVRSAMAIGEARAAAMVAAARAGVPVFEFAPTEVKESVTGWGGAPKEQVLRMVMVHLHLDEPPRPVDASDALAIALTRLADARLADAVAR